jgi:hypothetical protein
MRVQDWLADRLSFVQYAVPRVQPKRVSKVDWPKTRERLGDVVLGLAALLVLAHAVAKGLSPQKGQPPVAILFALAALAALPGIVIVTLL